MAHTTSSSKGSAVSKNLTVAQQEWLDGVIACMKEQIRTELEPDNDPRTPLEKVLADDHALQNMHYYYDGVMQEAQFMQLGSSQMPNFYALWVARRAELGRGPPLRRNKPQHTIRPLQQVKSPPATKNDSTQANSVLL
ncbi:hypothetical protein PSTT_13339 [Puccinia striiformis]|uniref:Uncharacterized protein n=1 Tax=Puccinia striiformis TaxID=27350 RepID=A0A2S4US52_9BASI|nr:hypothetical protein PSTT_13339 [Puccinia striiformis]